MLAELRLQLDGYGGEDRPGDHVARHKGHDHIIIKRTKGNRTRPKNEMTGQDHGRRLGLMALPFFDNKDQQGLPRGRDGWHDLG